MARRYWSPPQTAAIAGIHNKLYGGMFRKKKTLKLT